MTTEERREYNRNWYRKNREKMREYYREYRAKNTNKLRKYNKEYHKTYTPPKKQKLYSPIIGHNGIKYEPIEYDKEEAHQKYLELMQDPRYLKAKRKLELHYQLNRSEQYARERWLKFQSTGGE